MSDFITSIVDGLVKNADKLGSLQATSIWAFFTLILLGYIVWNLRMQKQAEAKAFEVRLEDSKIDSAVVGAVDKMSNEIKELRHSMKCTGGKDVQ